MNSPAYSLDATGCSARRILQNLRDKTIQFANALVTSIRNFVATPKIVGDYFIAGGSIYNIHQPAKEPTIGPVPNVIAQGYGSTTNFSLRQLGINFARHDFENVGWLYMYFNSNIEVYINVSVMQIGDLAPEAYITLSLARGEADTSLGYHNQTIVTSGELLILKRTGNKYLLRNMEGKEFTVVDNEGWIDLALDSIEWE